MQLNLQPTLQNELVKVTPLQAADFEELYLVASDPLIWEQHPARLRYQREVFEQFFAEALASGGAFLVREVATGRAIGSSRYYDYFPDQDSIAIGYTFLGRAYWGGRYNWALKSLMLDHAFAHVGTVVFHIGQFNLRSQKGTEKLGAIKVAEEQRDFTGATQAVHYVYHLARAGWEKVYCP
jgi:RimJ/RimL family protein N-acetyltransferase